MTIDISRMRRVPVWVKLENLTPISLPYCYICIIDIANKKMLRCDPESLPALYFNIKWHENFSVRKRWLAQVICGLEKFYLDFGGNAYCHFKERHLTTPFKKHTDEMLGALCATGLAAKIKIVEPQMLDLVKFDSMNWKLEIHE